MLVSKESKIYHTAFAVYEYPLFLYHTHWVLFLEIPPKVTVTFALDFYAKLVRNSTQIRPFDYYFERPTQVYF